MRHRFYAIVLVGLAAVLLLAGCGTNPIVPPPEAPVTETEPEVTEMPEYAWDQLLGRDSIRPIYEPEFVPADEAGYGDDELVMGIAIDGEAKAYLVSLLNGREMVNDELAGIPYLVTW
jgi:hypothetical protein